MDPDSYQPARCHGLIIAQTTLPSAFLYAPQSSLTDSTSTRPRPFSESGTASFRVGMRILPSQTLILTASRSEVSHTRMMGSQLTFRLSQARTALVISAVSANVRPVVEGMSTSGTWTR